MPVRSLPISRNVEWSSHNRLSEIGFPVVRLEVIKDAATHYGISESEISRQLKRPSVIRRIIGDSDGRISLHCNLL
jgi:hypothetical protein